MDSDSLLQCRLLNQKPMRVWAQKLRLAVPVAKKLLCASGRAALVSATGDARHATSPKGLGLHEMGSPALLAELLQRADKVKAHRGLAHSLIAVGLLAPGSSIESARKLFAHNDPRCNESYAIKDEQHYGLESAPPHAVIADTVELVKRMGWRASPQRRRIVKGTAEWRLRGLL